MKGVCAECGDTKPLTEDGVCKNRHGCEHRQYQHRVRTERLLAEMAQQEPTWPLTTGWDQANETIRNAAMRRHPGFRPLSGGAEQTNLWIDRWLHGEGQ